MKEPKHVPMLALAALAFIPLAPRQQPPRLIMDPLKPDRSEVRVDNSDAPLEQQVVGVALRLADMGDTVLPRYHIEEELENPRGHVLLLKAMDRTDPGLRARKHRRTPGQTRALVMTAARAFLRDMENDFIRSSTFTTLDMLTPEDRRKYRTFAWHADDYPGGPEGPNEAMVMALDEALSRIRPERRANSTPTAVVTKAEFDDAMWGYIQSRRRPVPGQEARQLDKDALAAFLMMREAAKRDGVDIVILSSDRRPEVAARNAERAGNPYAVASFSAHILGLAMDLKLGNNVDEVTTRPMSNIIAMRRSTVHKWLFLKGRAYGWYPYTHEPWHWEYNPPGFRERFRKGFAPVP